MKTREEYLINYQERLLGNLKNRYSSINKNVGASYALAILITFFGSGLIEEFSFSGAKFDLNFEQVLVYSSFFISLLYILVGYSFINVSLTIRKLIESSQEVLKINESALPISVNDTIMLAFGLTGLILAFARWQVSRILINQRIADEIEHSTLNVLDSIPKAISRIKKSNDWKVLLKISWDLITLFWTLLWLIFSLLARAVILIAIFVTPAFIAMNYLANIFMNSSISSLVVPLISFSSLFFATLILLICGSILFLSFLVDVIQSFKDEMSEKIIKIMNHALIKRFIELLEKIMIFISVAFIL